MSCTSMKVLLTSKLYPDNNGNVVTICNIIIQIHLPEYWARNDNKNITSIDKKITPTLLMSNPSVVEWDASPPVSVRPTPTLYSELEVDIRV